MDAPLEITPRTGYAGFDSRPRSIAHHTHLGSNGYEHLEQDLRYTAKTTQAGLELEQAAIDLAGTVKEINAQLRASFGLDAEELAQPAAIAETNGKHRRVKATV